MYLSDASKFAHRKNRDGSFDSICLKCFITIDNGNEEEDLDVAEYIHVCDVELSMHCYSVTSAHCEPRLEYC